MSTQKMTRNLSDPIVDKRALGAQPIRKDGPAKGAKGNPVKGARVFGTGTGKKG